MPAEGGHALRIRRQLRARPPQRAAHHVPDDEAVDALAAGDDLGAQPRMNAGPDVMLRIGAGIGANAPDHEFPRLRRAFEDVGVVAVEAAFQLYRRDPAVFQRHRIVMSVRFAGGFPIADEAAEQHRVERCGGEAPLLTHRRGELAAQPFDRAAKQPAVMEHLGVQPVLAERMGLFAQNLCEAFDLRAQGRVLAAGDDAHAAARPPAPAARAGSMQCRASQRTAGTATPSPTR